MAPEAGCASLYSEACTVLAYRSKLLHAQTCTNRQLAPCLWQFALPLDPTRRKMGLRTIVKMILKPMAPEAGLEPATTAPTSGITINDVEWAYATKSKLRLYSC